MDDVLRKTDFARMTGKKIKSTGMKLIIVSSVAFLIMGFVPFGVLPCSGMDTLTHSEMAELSGQAGITMTICGRTTIKATFNSLSYGDPDGCFNQQVDNPGWIVLIGDSGNEVGELKQTIPDGAVITIDVGTTGGTACSPSPYDGITIPANTPFFTFTLTDFTLSLLPPETVEIRGTHDPTGAPGTMDLVGRMKPENLSIVKDNNPARLSRCYVWAH